MSDITQIDEIARLLLPAQNQRLSTKEELRFGRNGSLSIKIDGEGAGSWYDHETNEGGGAVQLVMREQQCGHAEALTWISAKVGPSFNSSRNTDKSANKEITATYRYEDANGELRYEVIRYEPKTFRQRQPDGNGGWTWKMRGVDWLPYRLPSLLAARAEVPVIIVEGEKDADALSALGFVATTLPGGAINGVKSGSRADQVLSQLVTACAGRRVIVVADNDPPGRVHAQAIAERLMTGSGSVSICSLPDLPEHGDVSDFLAAGGDKESLSTALNSAPVFTQTMTEPQSEALTTEASLSNWYAECAVDKSGTVLATHSNLVMALRREPAWQGVLAFDEMQGNIILQKAAPVTCSALADASPFPREWRDSDSRRALEFFQILGFPTLKLTDLNHAIEQIAYETVLHPIRDRLSGLVWDGIDRINGQTTDEGEIFYPLAVRILGGEDTAYSREVIRVLLVGAVARIFEPGCKLDYIVVLEGSQGSGKSSFCRILAGDAHFTDGLRDMHSRDAAMHLQGMWIVEVSELSGLRKSDAETAKAFISRQEDRYRAPYGRHEETRPRQCIFIGTTNDAEYLKDPTGGRRFLPLSTGAIDVDQLKAERDQILAEAVYRYRHGERPVINNEVIPIAKAEQAQRYDEDVWAAPIASALVGQTEVTLAELLHDALGIEPGRQEQRHKLRLRGILQSLGWGQARTGKRRYWVRPCDSVTVSSK